VATTQTSPFDLGTCGRSRGRGRFPRDETYDKFGFYSAHGVDELIVADPSARTVTCWTLDGAAYRQTDRSELLAVTAAQLHERISWT
jgi:hypothetical protein